MQSSNVGLTDIVSNQASGDLEDPAPSACLDGMSPPRVHPKLSNMPASIISHITSALLENVNRADALRDAVNLGSTGKTLHEAVFTTAVRHEAELAARVHKRWRAADSSARTTTDAAGQMLTGTDRELVVRYSFSRRHEQLMNYVKREPTADSLYLVSHDLACFNANQKRQFTVSALARMERESEHGVEAFAIAMPQLDPEHVSLKIETIVSKLGICGLSLRSILECWRSLRHFTRHFEYFNKDQQIKIANAMLTQAHDRSVQPNEFSAIQKDRNENIRCLSVQYYKIISTSLRSSVKRRTISPRNGVTTLNMLSALPFPELSEKQTRFIIQSISRAGLLDLIDLLEMQKEHVFSLSENQRSLIWGQAVTFLEKDFEQGDYYQLMELSTDYQRRKLAVLVLMQTGRMTRSEQDFVMPGLLGSQNGLEALVCRPNVVPEGWRQAVALFCCEHAVITKQTLLLKTMLNWGQMLPAHSHLLVNHTIKIVERAQAGKLSGAVPTT